MAVDIFIYAEERKDDSWHYFGEFEVDSESEDGNIKPKEIFFPGPNASLRAILANHYNYGIEDYLTGRREEPYNYITLPRGLPKDVSKEIKDWAQVFDDELDTPSWLLLKELLDFDWNQKIVKRRMVHRKFAYLFEDESKGFPFSNWPRGEQISYGRYLSDGVFVSWTETYAESAGKDFIDFLNSAGSKYNPEKFRLVFWFG